MTSLQQQRQLLEMRKSMIAEGNSAEWADKYIFSTLRREAPGELKPVVVRRNHEPWLPAYLIERLNGGSCRILRIGADWEITWVRASAEVAEVPTRLHGAHAKAVKAFKEAQLEVEKCLTTNGKASKARRSKNANGRNSSTKGK